MKRFSIAVLGLALVGCADMNKEYYEANARREADVKKAEGLKTDAAMAAKADYYEVAHGGRIYVVGSEKAKADAEKGKAPAMTKAMMKYGPNGETVVFEAGKDGPALESKLMAEYNARHGKQ